MDLTIDFETRSKVDIKKAGAWRYAEDESTEVICLSVKIEGLTARLWIPDKFRDYFFDEYENFGIDLKTIVNSAWLANRVSRADTIEAHNAEFERAIWKHKMVPMGFPEIPIEKWRCSAAKAAACSLPRSLEGACEALNLPVQKDKEGHKLMLKMCKPRRPSKNNPNEWWKDPKEFIRLFKYCIQDVEAEYALSQILPDLSKQEQEVWFLDQKINERGIPIDIESCKAIIKMIEAEEEILLDKMKMITEGEVSSPRQRDATLKWLKKQGYDLPDLTKGTVEKLLETVTYLPVKAVLEIRQQLGKSSVSKFSAMLKMAGEDNRARGTLLYHAASTGRWGGRGIQPQNFKRAQIDDIEVLLNFIKAEEYEWVKMLWGEPFDVASKLIRGMICSKR